MPPRSTSIPPPIPRPPLRLLPLALAAALLPFFPTGCASRPQSPAPVSSLGAIPTSDVIYLFPQRAAVIPIPAEDAAAHLREWADLKKKNPQTHDADVALYPVSLNGLPLDATLYWVGLTPVPNASDTPPTSPLTPAVERSTSIAARAAAWSSQSLGGLTTRWTAIRADAAASIPPRAVGTWVVMIRPINPPPTPGRSYPITLGDRSFTALTLPLPDTSSARDTATPPPWIRAARIDDAQRASPWLTAALNTLAANPVQRWRVRLATGVPLGLPAASPPNSAHPDSAPPDFAPGSSQDMFLDPILEMLATQVELNWLSALRGVAAADPALAASLASELSRVIDFGRGISLPLWDTESHAETTLLEQLLAPTATPPIMADRARLWLDAKPRSLAWVADDAGAIDAISGEQISRIGAINLAPAPVVIWAGVGPKRDAADLARLDAAQARVIPVINAPRSTSRPIRDPSQDASPPPLPSTASREGVIVNVRVGTETLRRRACPQAAPALPPGCTIGPLRPDWTARQLIAEGSSLSETADAGPWAGARTSDLGWITAGRVYLGSPAESPVVSPPTTSPSPSPSTTSAPTTPGQWVLYLECLRDPAASLSPDSSKPTDGYLRVWLGPTGSPSTIYTVLWNGDILDESPNPAPPGAITARVAIEPNRLSCWIPLPPHAIEPSGVLRLGVERLDERGVRSAWPRALLPWESEPGRAAIDTRGWERIGR